MSDIANVVHGLQEPPEGAKNGDGYQPWRIQRLYWRGDSSLDSPRLMRHESSAPPLEGGKGGLKTPPSVDWDCRYKDWRWVNETTGEVTRFDCHTWRCVEHAPRLSWRWTVRGRGIRWSHFWTFTLVPEDRDRARVAWRRIVRMLRRYGVVSYLRAMEIGKGGMRHWHVLVRGPKDIPHEVVSRTAVASGLGKVAWVKRVTDADGAARYVLKYVTKGGLAFGERFKGWRRVTVSRDIPSWVVIKELMAAARRGTGDPGNDWRSYGSVTEVVPGWIRVGDSIRRIVRWRLVRRTVPKRSSRY